MSKDKKLYFQEYHKRTYVKKNRSCDVCFSDLTGSRKKRCDGCRIESTCIDCDHKFSYPSKYKRCSKCQYKWYKENTPDKFRVYMKKYQKKITSREDWIEDFLMIMFLDRALDLKDM